MAKLQEIAIETLIDRYEVLLLDAYGVLVHSSGTLAGAAELIAKLNIVMIGDQLATDIRGAHAFGLDSVLVGSGISNTETIAVDDHLLPTYTMQSIMPGSPGHRPEGPSIREV